MINSYIKFNEYNITTNEPLELTMYDTLKKSWDKTRYLIISGLAIVSLLLLTVVYKSDQKIVKKSEGVEDAYKVSDLKSLKEFLINQINSPFINLNYEIKKGDSIQRILSKYKVKNSEIQKVISKYKKYGNPAQLLIGNKIDIIIEKDHTENKNSIIRFSVPITKSTTIEITKNEENKIISNKIITKLYKRKVLSENIIKNNLYTSALEAKIGPETIIELLEFLVLKLIFKET